MKKIKLIKAAVILFAVFAFSNCEEDGPIEFVVADDFEQSVSVVGLAASNSFTESGKVDITELLNNNSFKDTEILEVTFTLQDDYEGASISLDVDLSVGTDVKVIDENVSLEKGVGKEFKLLTPIEILQAVDTNNMFSFNITATSPTALGDDDFTVVVSFKVKAVTATN